MTRAARRVLTAGSVMNAIAFGTKRAFHGFLRVTRRMLASYGLTAARFDLLYSIVRDGRRRSFANRSRQSDIRRQLGVTAPVVSRMVRSLESLGLVTREKEWRGDGRQRVVRLTDKGIELFFAARRVVRRTVQRFVDEAICFGARRHWGRRFANMARLESYLTVLRRDFGDRAALYFPWGHPDD